MKYTYTVSIIIPVFNCEKLIPNCLKSILHQSFTDFEVIIIDDGSTDNTFKICKEMTITQENIQLFNQQKQGVSIARNLGLSKAQGRLICFIDADDNIETNHLKNLVSFTDKYQDYFIVTNSNIIRSFSSKTETTYPLGSDIYEELSVKDLLSKKNFLEKGFPWDKIFKAEIIKEKGIIFKENIQMSGDLLFCLEYLKYFNKVLILTLPTYNYQIGFNPNSLMHYGFSNIESDQLFVSTLEDYRCYYLNLFKDYDLNIYFNKMLGMHIWRRGFKISNSSTCRSSKLRLIETLYLYNKYNQYLKSFEIYQRNIFKKLSTILLRKKFKNIFIIYNQSIFFLLKLIRKSGSHLKA